MKSSQSRLDSAEAAVLQAEREWAADARDQDLERSVSYVADDAIMFPYMDAARIGK